MDIMPAPQGHEPYPGCETGGRPLKYSKEYIEAEADAFEEWMKRPESIYFKRFAFQRGYHPNRLAEFAEENEKFSGVYSKAKSWQEMRLVEGGLIHEFNAGFAKFVMANVCGWTDKIENKISGDSANPLAFILQNVDGTTKELIDEK
jgi:hypothetical protein